MVTEYYDAARNLSIRCLSTDTKPTNVWLNTLLVELDTGDLYYWTGSAWEKVGG